MARAGTRLLGPLGWRLFAAFTLVGIGAIALLAVLAVVSVRGQTSGILASQQDQARRDIVSALAAAYTRPCCGPSRGRLASSSPGSTCRSSTTC